MSFMNDDLIRQGAREVLHHWNSNSSGRPESDDEHERQRQRCEGRVRSIQAKGQILFR